MADRDQTGPPNPRAGPEPRTGRGSEERRDPSTLPPGVADPREAPEPSEESVPCRLHHPPLPPGRRAGAGAVFALDAPRPRVGRRAHPPHRHDGRPTSRSPPAGPTTASRASGFTGYTLYDPLIAWDLSRADRLAELRPGLAESWSVDESDRTRWTLRLRRGVTFHDGSAFDAAAVAGTSPSSSTTRRPTTIPSRLPRSAAASAPSRPGRSSTRRRSQLVTRAPTRSSPISSPSCWSRARPSSRPSAATGRNSPSRPRGPGRSGSRVWFPRERRNSSPIPPTGIRPPAGLRPAVLQPMPEATTRVAALLSGRVDWIEAPAPDQIGALKAAGNRVLTNIYPHYWAYMPSYLPGSPFTDVRVRKAVNLASTGRASGRCSTADDPGRGQRPGGSPLVRPPSFRIRHDPRRPAACSRRRATGRRARCASRSRSRRPARARCSRWR